MKMYLGLTKRNMLVYFKDRQAILFSLLTSIILFVLYLLFLRGTFSWRLHPSLERVTHRPRHRFPRADVRHFQTAGKRVFTAAAQTRTAERQIH